MKYKDYLPFQFWRTASKLKHLLKRKKKPALYNVNIIKKSSNVPINIFIVLATKRSGHHAFIESLTNYLENFLYLNNTSDAKIVNYDFYKRKNILIKSTTKSSDIIWNSEPTKWPNRISVDLGKLGIGNIIFSFENQPVDRAIESARVKNTLKYNQVNSLNFIYFERDPLNVLASIVKVKAKIPNYPLTIEQQLRIWDDYNAFFNKKGKILDVDGEFTVHFNHLYYYDFIRNNISLKNLGVLQLEKDNTQILYPPKRLSKFGGGGDTFFKSSHYESATDIITQAESRFLSINEKEIVVDLLEKNRCVEAVLHFYKNAYHKTQSQGFKKIIDLLEEKFPSSQ